MAKQTEIVFSAKDNGVQSYMAKMRSSAQELSRGMANEAMSSSSNAEETVKHYENQIKLIERRNRLENQAAKITLERKRDRGLESAGSNRSKQAEVRKDYQKSMKSLQTASKEDQLQVELLKELISTVRNTSKSEKKGDDQRAHQERVHEERQSLRGRGGSGGRGRSGGSGGRGGSGGGVGGIGDGMIGGANMASTTLQQKKASGAAGSALGGATNAAMSMGSKAAVPLAIAYGLFEGGKAIWGGKEDEQLQLRELAALTGTSIGGLEPRYGNIGSTKSGGYGAVDLNMSREQFRTEHLPMIARAQGSTKGIFDTSGGMTGGGLGMEALEIQKGMAISPNIVGGLISTMKTTSNPGSLQGLTQKLYKRLNAGGAFGRSGQDMTRMQDIMSSYVSMQNEQFMRHGQKTSSTMNMDLLGRFEGMGGVYKDDRYKQSTIQSLDRGLASTGSPEMNAMKMSTLRRLNPDKSVFELEMEMEKGINAEGFLAETLKDAKSYSNDKSMQARYLHQMTGGQIRKADAMRMVTDPSFNPDYIGKGKGTKQGFDFEGKAKDASSALAADAMFADEWMDDVKVDIYDTIKEAFDYMKDGWDELMDSIGDWFDF